MGKFTTDHDINCDTDTYWNLVLNQDLLNELFTAELAYHNFSILEHRLTDKAILHKW